jgi:E3 ubiquitin-protein ligase NEDD4
VACQGDEVVDSVLTKTKKRTLNPRFHVDTILSMRMTCHEFDLWYFFRWDEEFLFRVKPAEHKLVLEVNIFLFP